MGGYNGVADQHLLQGDIEDIEILTFDLRGATPH